MQHKVIQVVHEALQKEQIAFTPRTWYTRNYKKSTVQWGCTQRSDDKKSIITH